MSVAPALLVLGATGAIGRGVVRAALDAGRPVLAVSSDREGLRELQGSHAHADLSTHVAQLRDERQAITLAKRLRKLDRPIDGVVAALCTERERGRLLDAPSAGLRDALDAGVVAHLALARHLLPLLASNGRAGGYVLIDGPGGDAPWAGYGHRSIGAAALRMLARVLHDEARPLGERVQLLTLEWPERTEANARHACDQRPSALGLGRRALAMLDRNERTRTEAIVSCKGPCPPEDTTQGSDSGVSLLTSRCLQDARTLLGSLLPSPTPSPLDSKEDAHDRSNRR
jgi:NAD(P)-dependent dehydrogenase (short-subunit alcohol dehydrogenase family)